MPSLFLSQSKINAIWKEIPHRVEMVSFSIKYPKSKPECYRKKVSIAHYRGWVHAPGACGLDWSRSQIFLFVNEFTKKNVTQNRNGRHVAVYALLRATCLYKYRRQSCCAFYSLTLRISRLMKSKTVTHQRSK